LYLKTTVIAILFSFITGCAEDKAVVSGEITDIECVRGKTSTFIILHISEDGLPEGLGFYLEGSPGCKTAAEFFSAFRTVHADLHQNNPYRVVFDKHHVFEVARGERLVFSEGTLKKSFP